MVKLVKPPELDGVYHLRVCLIGSDDIDIKRYRNIWCC